MSKTLRAVSTCFLVTLVALALCALAIWQTLRTYHVLTRRDVVAMVECIPSPSVPDEFRLVYRTMNRGKPGPAQVFQLYGNEWSVGGELLIWKGWALLAGQKTWYKVSRIEGRAQSPGRDGTWPYLVYDVGGGRDWLWKMLYRFQDWIPGVETVYGSSVYMPAEAKKIFVVYATPSGFLAKAHRRLPKYPLPPTPLSSSSE